MPQLGHGKLDEHWGPTSTFVELRNVLTHRKPEEAGAMEFPAGG